MSPKAISSPLSPATGYNTFLASRAAAPDPVEAFGPVPDMAYPWVCTRQGARYCSELDAYVPADLFYRVRTIRKAEPSKTLVERLLGKKQPVQEATSIVTAGGLTHGKMRLISLKEARKNERIRHYGLDGRREIEYDTVKRKQEKTQGRRLIELWEAQARPDMVYGGTTAC